MVAAEDLRARADGAEAALARAGARVELLLREDSSLDFLMRLGRKGSGAERGHHLVGEVEIRIHILCIIIIIERVGKFD